VDVCIYSVHVCMYILRINSMREIYSVCKYKVTQIACTCDVKSFVSTCDSFRIYMSRPYIVCISIPTFTNSTGPCHIMADELCSSAFV